MITSISQLIDSWYWKLPKMIANYNYIILRLLKIIRQLMVYLLKLPMLF